MARAIPFLLTRRLCATTTDTSSAQSTCWLISPSANETKKPRSTTPRLSNRLDDAIISKDINGVITSWNSGAQRLFGYTSQEAVGKPVTILIPANRHDEEPKILERIRRGERIDHYETVRQRKDGSLIDISLTVSPIRDLRGNIIGASKIARDITERKRAEERQDLLLREMDHRIKNLFALAIGIVSLSGRSAKNVQDLVRSARERLSALARAHALTLSHGPKDDPQGTKPTTLHSLIRTIIAPHEDIQDAQGGADYHRWTRPRDFRLCDLESGASAARIRYKFGEIWSALQRQTGGSRSSAPNTAKHSSSHGRNAADPRSTPRQTAKDLAPLSLARRSRANSVGRSPETGSPKDSSSVYRYPASV